MGAVESLSLDIGKGSRSSHIAELVAENPMPSSVACIVIAGGKRTQLLDEKNLPSVLSQGFSETVVVGDYRHGDGYRYLHVPGLTNTTIDALPKRDVGTLATEADILVYLSDDHGLAPDFLATLRTAAVEWDVVVPSRWCRGPMGEAIRLNMGATELVPYCGGHAGIFRRWVIQARPWSAMPHDRLWDLLASQIQQNLGARFVHVPQVAIEDLEPEREPWK